MSTRFGLRMRTTCRERVRFAVLAIALAVVPAPAQQADPVIERARKAAADFVRSSPDYIVKRTTTSYTGTRPDVHSPANLAGNWEKPDIVSAQVTYVSGAEAYRNIFVNGKPARRLSFPGAWTEGEFSSVLRDVLAPSSAALFTNQRIESIANHLAYRYDFEIDQPHSAWELDYEDPGGNVLRYSPAFGGAIWIDTETGQVLRIERLARAVPGFYPLAASQSATDYGFVTIGGEKYCLPIHSEDITCMQRSRVCYRSVTDFEDYQKFRADTSVSFGGGAKQVTR